MAVGLGLEGVYRIKENVAVTTKLAVLWLFVAVSNSAIITIALLAPGVIDDIRSGQVLGAQIGPELLLVMAITYYWIPLVMSVLSVTLKNSINRWANIIAGMLYAFFVLNEMISNIVSVAYFYGIMMHVSEVVIVALIVWFAWKWPKET